MTDNTRLMLRLAFPAGLCLLIISGAAVFFGADIPAARTAFASAILFIFGAGMLTEDSQRPTASSWGALALIGAFAVLTQMRGQMDTAAPEFAALLAAGGLWLVARNAARLEGGGVVLWRASLGAGALIALWSFFSFTLSPESVWGLQRPYGGERLTGGFLSANTAATFFGLVSLMGLAETLQQVRRASGSLQAFSRQAVALSLSVIATLLPLTCLVLTASRGGIAFTVFAALLLVVWQLFSWGRQEGSPMRGAGLAGAGIGALVVLGGLVWTVSGELASSRFDTVMDDPVRQAVFAAYWEAVSLSPVFGQGLGSFAFTNDLIATSPNALVLEEQGAAHNVYLQWLMQAGWVGSIVMWTVVAGMIALVIRGLRHRRKHHVYMRATLCISLLVLLHGLTDYGLEVAGFMWWFAWVLGIGAGFASGSRSVRKAERKALAGQHWSRRLAPSAILGVTALGLAFWSGWQAELRYQANIVDGFSPERMAAYSEQATLPPLATLREALAARAVQPDIADLDFAERATRAALEREPRIASAWNRLVYLDLARNDRLSQEGLEAYARSLYLSPYGDREVMRWRLEIAAIVWDQLDETTRGQALSQVLVLSYWWIDRRWMEELAERAPAPMGSEIRRLLPAEAS
ncbi:MAG: O-antigen ligase family protein [Caulobacterales bacterium]|uniref:O-antigen ligase family protein n=1 Tax=Glycocaulis sp. TaxID=1969725 RepID=UPI003FA1361F